MQLRLLEKQKDTLRLEVSNPDDTLIHPLVAALLKDGDVADALYYSGHPQLDKPVLTIRTKKGNPQAALKRAAQNLSDEFSSARTLLEKELV
jgi:DNA-directed RNA polymerase subunit L